MRRVIVLAILATLCSPAAWLSAQDSAAKAASALRGFAGIRACRNCHISGSLPKKDDPNLDPFEAALLGTGAVDDRWVKLDEYKTWLEQDKHSQAFTSLLNERSKRMSALLGVEVQRDKRCLACHVGFPLAELGGDHAAIPVDQVNDVRLLQGVSCEGCHAPSDDARAAEGADVKGWLGPHAKKESWRFLSVAVKWENFGFRNVRSVSTRARMCLSCHLGNAAEGRIVTHEMYAAGHPPLPGFELANFAYQLPKHWRDFDQKTANVREEFLKRNESAGDTYVKASYQLENLHETHSLLVGALVAFSENLKLSAALADREFKTPVAKPDWPELAQFECFACHHDLKDASWRQSRTLRGAPGRPILRTWPTALTKVALKHAKGDEQRFAELWQPVEKLLNDQPFGRPDGWQTTIAPLTKWLDDLASSLERQSLPRDAGWPLLGEIAAVAESELWDYDSARQLVWATQVLHRELSGERSPEPLRTRTVGLSDQLKPIEQLFVLDLIAGRTVPQILPGGTKGRPVKEVELEKTLPPIADYDAATFRDKFRKLASKLAVK